MIIPRCRINRRFSSFQKQNEANDEPHFVMALVLALMFMLRRRLILFLLLSASVFPAVRRAVLFLLR